MPIFQADYIFPISSKPIQNGVLKLDDAGKIEGVFSENNHPFEQGEIKKIKGILSPAFINAHCHLELSHLKNKVSEKTGLNGFVRELQSIRNNFNDIKLELIVKADQEMWENGIQAVGDICNSNDSFSTKTQSKIKYHNFIELFGFFEHQAHKIIEQGKNLALESENLNISNSLVPHAPYSVSDLLFLKIKTFNKKLSVVSIHNQESAAENEMFMHKSGKMIEALKNFGFDESLFKTNGKSSIQNYFEKLASDNSIILIHNTFTNENDLLFAQHLNPNIFWCFCPNANLYIENKLPDFDIFLKNEVSICLGTDSLASNHQLSIWEEMKTIHQNKPNITFETLLTWATLNGAKALKMDKDLGGLEVGKNPGIIAFEGNLEHIFDAKLTRIC